MVRVPVLDPPARPAEPEPKAPLKHAPDGWSYVTETIVLADTGDKLAPGVGQLIARDVCESIAVRNLGAFDVIVCAGQANDRPDALYGPGTAIVRSGEYVTLHMPEQFHAFYGYPGELVEVTRFRKAQPPFASQGQGIWEVVYTTTSLGLGSTNLFSTFWGTRANYGGFTARETGLTDPVIFTIYDGDPGGGGVPILGDVRLSAGGSTEEDDTNLLCRDSAIWVDFLGGGGILQFSLRAR